MTQSDPASRGKEHAAAGEAGKMAKPARPATPQPKPQSDPAAGLRSGESSVGSGSATGFVSMLAKRQLDNDSLAATPGDARRARENLPMAREVRPPAEENASSAPAKSQARIPLWHRFMFVLTWGLALSLVGVGTWAVGALLYMHNVSPIAPHDVHYPMIRWKLEGGGSVGGYTQASRIMAWSMLLCFPVAIMLVIMSRMIRRRVRS